MPVLTGWVDMAFAIKVCRTGQGALSPTVSGEDPLFLGVLDVREISRTAWDGRLCQWNDLEGKLVKPDRLGVRGFIGLALRSKAGRFLWRVENNKLNRTPRARVGSDGLPRDRIKIPCQGADRGHR